MLTIIILLLLIDSAIFISSLNINRSINYRKIITRLFDDETQRPGIKDDLTTRDEYLESRFIGLSSSNYDITAMTAEDIADWDEHHVDYSIQIVNQRIYNDTYKYLGYQEKGLYVSRIGGLPLFTSGYRLDELCSERYLVFSEPCDSEHIRLGPAVDSQQLQISTTKIIQQVSKYNFIETAIQSTTLPTVHSAACTRSQQTVGYSVAFDSSIRDTSRSNLSTSSYIINSSSLVFLPLNQPIPVESQPGIL